MYTSRLHASFGKLFVLILIVLLQALSNEQSRKNVELMLNKAKWPVLKGYLDIYNVHEHHPQRKLYKDQNYEKCYYFLRNQLKFNGLSFRAC